MLTFFRTVIVVFAACGSAVGAEPKLLPRELLDAGWISLFDGETLFGWQPTGDAKWEVVDGEIRTSGEKSGWLMTTSEWANFQLNVEFRRAAATNSGVFLRTPLNPKDPTRDCYEINIAPRDNPFPTGSVVGLRKVDADTAPIDPAKWHTLGMAAYGHFIGVSLDGHSLYRYRERLSIRVGHIGLQSNSGRVEFRNIRLQPMYLKSLFNGHDLSEWNQERAEKCRFEVTKDGELHLSNGPGQIETAKDFRNFVLQLECKVNGKGLNSGIFFRTLREGRWAGYESQIQNGFKDGDRTKPKDFGTGAIYRRQPARYVVPNDREWFTKTIVADGPHFAVWVNGYQVSDWTDTRPEKESGREGLRLGGGAIAIQGHDATTDFLFRKIRAAELAR